MTLSTAQIDEFKNAGYLIVRRMVPPATCDSMLVVTAEQLQAAIAPLEYEAELGYPGAPDSLDAAGGRTVRRLRGAYQRHRCFRDWACDPALIADLAQLFDEGVCLTLAHHNCVMTKHPDFGTATGWHRDIRYWSYTKPDLISVWLALGPETAINGGLQFIPASHRIELQSGQLDELDFLRPDVAHNQALFAQGQSTALDRGDVVFFDSRLFHAAGRNTSGAAKTSVVFAYHGTSNAPVAGTRSAAGEDIFLDPPAG